ncbi:hypothetical protein RKD55_000587 [Rossellomorea marisflavi]
MTDRLMPVLFFVLKKVYGAGTLKRSQTLYKG